MTGQAAGNFASVKKINRIGRTTYSNNYGRPIVDEKKPSLQAIYFVFKIHDNDTLKVLYGGVILIDISLRFMSFH